MPEKASNRTDVVLFGILFLSTLSGAFFVASTGAWFLVLSPFVGLPVYFYGRMFFSVANAKTPECPSKNLAEFQRQTASSNKEETGVAVAFFLMPLLICAFVIIYNNLHPKSDAKVAESRQQPNSTLTSTAPTKDFIETRNTPDKQLAAIEKTFESLRIWHQQLVSRRATLNLADQAAVVEFNNEVARYHSALHGAQRTVAQNGSSTLSPTASSYPVTQPSNYRSSNYSYPPAGGVSGTSTTAVSGYIRPNGTFVAPHLRTSADQTTTNNWSHSGNVNPVTGARGYHR